MNFSLRQLQYFAAVARHANFQRAADACFVSQPGLSTQLAQLETALGVVLFERDRRHVRITPPGAELLPIALSILAQARDLAEVAQRFERPLCGAIRLGVIPTVAPYYLPGVLPRLRAAYPDLRLVLSEGQTGELVAALQRGELDILLLALEAELGDVRTMPLARDEFYVAAPPQHPLAGRRRLTEADLEDAEVLLLDDGHCLRDQALEVCTRSRLVEQADFRATSLTMLAETVAGGTGITILPAMTIAVEAERRGLKVIPFKKPRPFRTIGLAWRSTSPRSDEFTLLGEVLKR